MQITRNMRARTTRIPIETGSTNKESLFLTVGSSVRCKILIMLVVMDITDNMRTCARYWIPPDVLDNEESLPALADVEELAALAVLLTRAALGVVAAVAVETNT